MIERNIPWTKQPQYPVAIKQDALSSGLVCDFNAATMRNAAGATQPVIVGSISNRVPGVAGLSSQGAYQTSDNYVNLGRPSITNNQITIEALVTVNAFQTVSFPYISGIVGGYQSDAAGGAGGAYAGPILRFNPDATLGNAAVPVFILSTGNGTTEYSISGTALSVGVLYHIVATYDGSVATLLVNGVQVAQATHSITFDYHASTFFAGLSDYAVATATLTHNRCLNGKLFAVRVYNKSKLNVAGKLASNLWQIYQPQERNIYVSVASTITADASITQSGDTVSGASALSISADAAISAAGDTSSSASVLSVAADANITHAGDTASAESVLSIAADTSITQAGNTSTADSVITILADVSATQDSNTISSTAALVAETITANANITQDGNTSTADGSIVLAADLSVTQAGDTTASASGLLLAASADITQIGDSLASTAALASDTITANADITQAGDTSSADSLLAIVAGATLTQDGNTITFDSALVLAAVADITQAGNTLTSAAGSNTWTGEPFNFASPITRTFGFTSSITKTLSFDSPI